MIKKEYLQPGVDVVHLAAEESIMTGSTLNGVGGTNLGTPSDLSGDEYNDYF